MKRKLTLYILLIALIIWGVPFFTGKLVAYNFNAFVNAVSQNENIAVAVVSYKSGWRQSVARTRVTLTGGWLKQFIEELQEEAAGKENPQKAQAGPLSFILEHEIRHGPFVQVTPKNHKDWIFAKALIQSKLEISNSAKTILQKEIGHADLFTFTTQLDLDGKMHLDWVSDPVSLEIAGETHPFWEGMKGHWNIGAHFKTLEGELRLFGFHFQTENARYQAHEIFIQSKRFVTPKGVKKGADLITTTLFELQRKQSLPMKFEGVKISREINPAKPVVSSSISIQKLLIGDLTFDTIRLKENSPEESKPLILKAQNETVELRWQKGRLSVNGEVLPFPAIY